MKIIFFSLFFIFTFNLKAENIATFSYINIFDNLNSYKDFINNIESFKKKNFDSLRIEEENLIQKKNEIEEYKFLLSEEEYKRRVLEFNELKLLHLKSKKDAILLFMKRN